MSLEEDGILQRKKKSGFCLKKLALKLGKVICIRILSILSNGTFCNDGYVLYLHCPTR